MTIDEAIIHAREVAEEQRKACDLAWVWDNPDNIKKCAEEHEQLAEWLEELKSYRASVFSGDMTQKMLKEEYNKAVYDFSKRIKRFTYTSGTESDGYYKIHAICERDIDEIAEQLNAGDGE